MSQQARRLRKVGKSRQAIRTDDMARLSALEARRFGALLVRGVR